MSCYHPLVGIRDKLNDEGKWIYKVLPYSTWDPSVSEIYPGSVRIPCGHCLGCKLDYSRSWADRMMLELDHSKKAIFITLTYNEEFLPIVYDDADQPIHCNLNKRDLTLFLKRLRRAHTERLRFYACGEYGSDSERAHYHIILFGLGLEDLSDLQYRGKSKLGFPLWSSDDIGRHWYPESDSSLPAELRRSLGFNRVAEVSWKTCAYVARYVQKKIYHGVNSFLVVDDAFQPEFSVMSRRPGIGAFFIQDHPDVFGYSKIFVSGRPDGISTPKFFLNKLKLQDPDLYDKICGERKEFAQDALLLKMQQTDLCYFDLLRVEEDKKYRQVSCLRRDNGVVSV